VDVFIPPIDEAGVAVELHPLNREDLEAPVPHLLCHQRLRE